MRLHALIATIALTITAAPSFAVSRYERVEFKEIKGKEPGLSITLTLRAEGSHAVARVGLGPGTMKNTESFSSDGNGRKLASDKSAGYLLHQFDEVEVKPNEPKKLVLKVLYKDNPKLVPGQKVELITAFNTAKKDGYWHVYGLKALGGTQMFDLPGQKAAKRIGSVKRLKRQSPPRQVKRRSTTSRRTAKKAKPAPARRARTAKR